MNLGRWRENKTTDSLAKKSRVINVCLFDASETYSTPYVQAQVSPRNEKEREIKSRAIE